MSSPLIEKRRLIDYSELPPWSHDNEFIVTGYRAPGGTIQALKDRADRLAPQTRNGSLASIGLRKRSSVSPSFKEHEKAEIEEHNSFRRCFESVWLYVHNETINIHSHMWGAIIVVIAVGLHILGAHGKLPTWLHPITHHSIFFPAAIKPLKVAQKSFLPSFLTSKSRIAQAAPKGLGSLFHVPALRGLAVPWHPQRGNGLSDYLGFASFLFGATTVLVCSATFHTVACHSRSVAKAYNKLDYVGIVAMIVGSFLPLLHYGFYCHRTLQHVYNAMIVTLGTAATYTVLSRKFTSPAYRPIRTSVFIALGLSAVFPVTHILAMYGYDAVSRTMGLNYLVAGGALYIVGACLYMARIPERFRPGAFDIVGASHQIFHIFILFAAFSHYVCLRRSYHFWHTVEALSGTNPGLSGDGGATHQAICAAFELLRNN